MAGDPRFHLLVVGDGPLRSEVMRLAEELPGRVTMTGAIPMEEVPPWIRGMDIAVAPYPRLERFYFSPLKILDAMACGVPNVASDIGQIPELLRDGETGSLVPPGDTDALASALIRLGTIRPNAKGWERPVSTRRARIMRGPRGRKRSSQSQ